MAKQVFVHILYGIVDIVPDYYITHNSLNQIVFATQYRSHVVPILSHDSSSPLQRHHMIPI